MSSHTVSQHLSQVETKASSPVIEPPISKTYKVARIVFAEKHITSTDDNWSLAHFSNESILNIVSSDGHQHVRRRTEERLHSKCVKKFVQLEEEASCLHPQLLNMDQT